MTYIKSVNLPKYFVFLTDIDSTIIESVRYYGDENFLGRKVPGYEINRIICTQVAAEKLKLVHDDVKKQGYNLVIYDGYRPAIAPLEFLRWSTEANDQVAKKYYYPTIDKQDMFELGYIAKYSSHSRGSTFDLTLIKTGNSLQQIQYTSKKLTSGEEIPFLNDNTVDMGSSFDLFHQASHPDSKLVNEDVHKNREILLNTMKKHGFTVSKVEWWHYTLNNEPFPNSYFDFVIKEKF